MDDHSIKPHHTLLLDLLVFTVKFKTIFSFSQMLNNLLCKEAVSAVLLNNNRKSSCLNEGSLCPRLSQISSRKPSQKNKIIETISCKFLEYHIQSFNFAFSVFRGKNCFPNDHFALFRNVVPFC